MQKHHFKADSLLTTGAGALKVSVIPALGQPDWLVPSALILDTVAIHEPCDDFVWQENQTLPVYSLVPKGASVDTMIVLEGNRDSERLALQTLGQIQTMRVRMLELKDTTLSQEEFTNIKSATPQRFCQHGRAHFVYQAVQIGDELYLVPDLDAIAEAIF